MKSVALLFAISLASGCAMNLPEGEDGAEAGTLSFAALPATRWDHRPEGSEWTQATLEALQDHGAPLVTLVPEDIEEYCPGYAERPAEDRSAFWVGLFSALAFHESTWNPSAVGGGGLWYGLTQIDPRTARGYGCQAQSGGALKDGEANLSCAVRIAARQVPKSGTVSRGMRDWGPFHNSSKRAEMAAFTRSQDYCQPPREDSKNPVFLATVKDLLAEE